MSNRLADLYMFPCDAGVLDEKFERFPRPKYFCQWLLRFFFVCSSISVGLQNKLLETSCNAIKARCFENDEEVFKLWFELINNRFLLGEKNCLLAPRSTFLLQILARLTCQFSCCYSSTFAVQSSQYLDLRV